jgi:hypothetical protein
MPRARRRVEVEQVDTRTGHTRGGRHSGIGQRYDTTSSRQYPATTQRSVTYNPTHRNPISSLVVQWSVRMCPLVETTLM